jgi:hypothetical protein
MTVPGEWEILEDNNFNNITGDKNTFIDYISTFNNSSLIITMGVGDNYPDVVVNAIKEQNESNHANSSYELDSSYKPDLDNIDECYIVISNYIDGANGYTTSDNNDNYRILETFYIKYTGNSYYNYYSFLYTSKDANYTKETLIKTFNSFIETYEQPSIILYK